MAVQPFGLGPQVHSASVAILQLPEDASETWGRGAILDDSTSNTIREASADVTSEIVGVAAERASGTTSNLSPFYPAMPGVVFEGNLSTGGANPPTAYVLLIGDALNNYALQIDTSQTTDQGVTITGVWYLDQADTTAVSAQIIGFRDAVGTSDARVYFHIHQANTIYNT